MLGLFQSIARNAPLGTPRLSPIGHGPILSSKQEGGPRFREPRPVHQFDAQALFKFRDIVQLQHSFFTLEHARGRRDGSFFGQGWKSCANSFLGGLPGGIPQEFLGRIGIVGVPFVTLNGIACETSVMIVKKFEERVGRDPMGTAGQRLDLFVLFDLFLEGIGGFSVGRGGGLELGVFLEQSLNDIIAVVQLEGGFFSFVTVGVVPTGLFHDVHGNIGSLNVHEFLSGGVPEGVLLVHHMELSTGFGKSQKSRPAAFGDSVGVHECLGPMMFGNDKALWCCRCDVNAQMSAEATLHNPTDIRHRHEALAAVIVKELRVELCAIRPVAHALVLLADDGRLFLDRLSLDGRLSLDRFVFLGGGCG